MAAPSSYTHISKSHLPPSPPPSPPAHRRRHVRKRSDSFEKLANTPLPSPPSEAQEPLVDHNEEPLLVRIILTPILFTSFILSLTLVNIRDRLRRTYAHSSTSILTYLYPSSWLDIEPYQVPGDSKWARRGSEVGHFEPHDAIGLKDEQGRNGKREKRKSWHLNKKIRKVARLEVSDAFEIRGWVMLGMGVLGMFCLGAFGMLVRYALG